MIKERENCGNSLIRAKARKDLYENLYQNLRGMVEGVFGGMETAYGNKTRCRLHRTRQADVMLMVACTNRYEYPKNCSSMFIKPSLSESKNSTGEYVM